MREAGYRAATFVVAMLIRVLLAVAALGGKSW